MPAKDLGTKFVCFKCGTKFYDLKKPDPLCPKCGADQRESPANKPAEGRRSRLAVAKAIAPVEPEEELEVKEEVEDDLEEIEEDEVDEDVQEDDEA